MSEGKITILVIDRSAVERDLLKSELGRYPDIDVIGVAPNGNIGLIKTGDLRPDLVLLDAGVEDLSPVDFTVQSRKKISGLGIVLMTTENPSRQIIDRTVESLEKGAFDFIEKPSFEDGPHRSEVMIRKLLPKIRGYSIKRYTRLAKIATGKSSAAEPVDPGAAPGARTGSVDAARHPRRNSFRLVAFGVSTGGPEAMGKILSGFPSDFPLPIVMVMHMPKNFTASMAADLDRKSDIGVREAADGDPLAPGTAYLARGGSHLRIVKGEGDSFLLRLDEGPPVKGCRPSVDILFKSVAESAGSHAIAIILTGMGDDGVEGMIALKKKGAITIAQDQDSSVVWGMPGESVKAGAIDEVVALDRIAERVMELI